MGLAVGEEVGAAVGTRLGFDGWHWGLAPGMAVGVRLGDEVGLRGLVVGAILSGEEGSPSGRVGAEG